MDTPLAKQLTQNVKEFYETHGTAFSKTRHQYWDVFEQIKSLCKPGDTLVDIGAGNGRLKDYLPEQTTYLGIEPSDSLRANHPEIQKGQLPELPLQSEIADITTCIAVLHHVPTIELDESIQELIRVTKTGGHLIATAWHLDPTDHEAIPNAAKGDVWVKWRAEGADAKRYVHLFTQDEWEKLWTHPCLEIIYIGFDEHQKNRMVVAQKTC